MNLRIAVLLAAGIVSAPLAANAGVIRSSERVGRGAVLDRAERDRWHQLDRGPRLRR